jgi:uncharacterized protein GlcG (DUF336 family)
MSQLFLFVCSAMILGREGFAQGAPAVPEAMPFDIPYGAPITLYQAKKVAAAAEAEARRHNWKMACAVVEPAGQLVYFEKLDGTMYASIAIAEDKARMAAIFRRCTKVFQDRVNSGLPAFLSFSGMVAIEGGLPLLENGTIIGAIGCSGGAAAQDGVVAGAGAQSLK